METFFGIVIGTLASLGIVTYWRSFRKKLQTKTQSVILLEKIRTVCKLITVEGDFAEIYHYENVKERFLKLIESRKKALVVINAKAHVGYDLSKIVMESDTNRRMVILKNFPQPEVLSIETNLTYYDKKEGYFNKFKASDLTGLNADARQHILDKVPDSGLLDAARQEALEAILLIESIVETIGWKLDYSSLKLPEKSQKVIVDKEN
ncbi:DUF4230 domain-containing protein [Aegicerativicinus sediminis]|uniref:DUF4230 domain-containing protein n=1 Tax=Aegicerativicinus sediminis TaxID=2893202 RepID=UPI001E54DDD9|nr:DUF4230 domain-containing protein [Aegicerativicinus sediminis]